jgi:hypothetical protein
MDFTFGIITTVKSQQYLAEICNSIFDLQIPNFEIIIIGDCNIISSDKINVYPFDETIKPNWITKKKNIIFNLAKYENIAVIHDYFKFDKDWYNGFLKFGQNFKYCSSKTINKNGNRFRDYILQPWPLDEKFKSKCLIPYDIILPIYLRKLLYISAAYFVIKKDIALKFQFNEQLCWNQGDDTEFCRRLAKNNIFISFNPYSTIHLLKQKWQTNWEKIIDPDILNDLLNISIEESNRLFIGPYGNANDVKKLLSLTYDEIL